MMQCRDIDDLMVDYLYQELDAARMAELEAHVHGCARCEAEIGRLQRTRMALRELPELEPSTAVSTRLLHEASKRAKMGHGGLLGWLTQLFQPMFMHPAWTAGATAVVLLAVTALLTMSHRGVSSRVQDVEVAEEQRENKVAAPASPGTPTAPMSAPADTAAQAPAAAEQPPAVRTPESPIPSEGGKVASPPLVSGPARERAAEGKSAATGRIASPSEQKPLASMKKQAAPARDEPAANDKNESDDTKGAGGPGAQPAAASSPPPPAPRGAASEADGLAAKESRRPDLAAADNERSHATGSDAVAAAPAQTAAPAKPSPQPSNKLGALRSKAEASAPPQSEARSQAQSQVQSGAQSGAQSVDRRAEAAAPAAPAPPATTTTAAPEPIAEKTADQVAKDEAKAPPEQALFRQAQQEAAGGRCGNALTIVQKIQRTNPEFYRKRIAGDPTLESCSSQRKAKTAAPKAPSKALEVDKSAADKPAADKPAVENKSAK